MKHAFVLAAGAALILAACQKSENGTEAAAGATEAATPAPEPAAAAPAGAAAFTAGEAPSKDFILGKWGEDGDCQLAIEFKADGSMVGPFEKWSLENGELLMEGNPQKMKMTVVDANTMESRIGDNAPHKVTRCP